jgi:phosphatidylinositol alpha-1,6-mannosyltransferase
VIDEVLNKQVIGNPALVTVGRLSYRKGQLNVIKQLPELLKTFPNLHYHCIGIAEKAEEFMEVAKALDVESHITFHGSLEHEAMKQVLIKSDIFTMLSSESKTGDVEGYGIAILEANALGLPAIGSTNCGIEDAINPNLSGILISPNDTVHFKNAISFILQNNAIFKNEAKKWAGAHNWSTIINQYIALIE